MRTEALAQEDSARKALRELLAKRASLAEGSRLRRLFTIPLRVAVAKAAGLLADRTKKSFRVVARTFWGADMVVYLPEPLSVHVYKFGFFERGLSEFLLSYLGRGQTFFDIGAHFGYFTLLASHLVGESGSVHAFEPASSTFKDLANSSTQSNIILNQLAVWSECCELEFQEFGLNESMYNSLFAPRMEQPPSLVTRKKVRAVSLDCYLDETGAVPDFVKIDAESAELFVLKGMRETIRKHKPIISLEVGDFEIEGAPSSRELLESVITQGYDAFELTEGHIRPHKLLTRYKYDNILLKPI